MNYDIIIIGGGASGLCTAINAKTDKNSILVLEHNDRVGKKILSTGNGKCNLTNEFCKVALFDYNPEGMYPYETSGSTEFVEKVIEAFDADSTVSFFEGLGMLTENKNGYIYPRSEQASTVCDILRKTCESIGVKIVTGFSASGVSYDRKSSLFNVDGKYFSRKLVIAAGGKSSAVSGSDGSGYIISRSLGHTIVPTFPGLCAIYCDGRFFRELAGVRNDTRVTLYDEQGNEQAQSYGNLQFTAYGISGIPAFQLSARTARLLAAGRKPVIRLDLLPEIESENVLKCMIDRNYPGCSGEDRLTGLLNKKLASALNKEIQSSTRHLGESYGRRLAPVIKKFKLIPTKVAEFRDSQVTCGGVSTDEIDPETMESRLVKGLYFTGEIIDVNGICGGYNLQWAWSTAHVAGQALKN